MQPVLRPRMPAVIESRIVPNAAASELSPRQVGSEFRKLLDRGARLLPAGEAKDEPESLLSLGYTPKYKVQLFDATYYLTRIRDDANFRFFVAYVALSLDPEHVSRRTRIHPRIFYKDSSLIWRAATHFIWSDNENWIGKGDLKAIVEDGVETWYSAEETTNLPYEIQAALDDVSRRQSRVPRDERAVGLVLRHAPDDRLAPYDDFSAPRRRARADARNLVNAGRYVAWFERPGDPSSLRFEAGFEPDFARGLVDESRLASRLYGGEVRKLRFLSRNRQIQYQFLAAPRQVWIIPPQTLTTEISSYGVRTLDVHADEDLCVPGYEYHFMDDSEDPPQLCSQIPKGWAGAASEVDPSRADASPWIEQLPVIQEFRKRLRIRARSAA